MNLNGLINYYDAEKNEEFIINIVFDTVNRSFYFVDENLLDELYEELVDVSFRFDVEFNKEHYMLNGEYLEDGFFEAKDDKYFKILMAAINYKELNKELNNTNNVSKNKKRYNNFKKDFNILIHQ